MLFTSNIFDVAYLEIVGSGACRRAPRPSGARRRVLNVRLRLKRASWRALVRFFLARAGAIFLARAPDPTICVKITRMKVTKWMIIPPYDIPTWLNPSHTI